MIRLRSIARGFPFASCFVVVACAGAPPASAPPQATASRQAAKRAGDPPRFENPGGMWMPHQMLGHARTLKELGLALDPAALSDPTSGVLSAVVSLGGCSASFVSPEGLVVTNHHCATGALQHNSTPQENLLKQGFLAKTRAEERSNGPQARVFVTRAVTDVTRRMRDGIEAIADDAARHKALEQREKEIVSECEKGRRGLRCTAAAFYEGARFFLVEQLEIRDVRLVWAPPSGVGNYGGEIDNWRWPRHTGDVAMFRAYVGPDGQPADYAPANVPYRPPHHLRVAEEPVREGDLVFVAGYPARTSSLKTSAEVEEAVTWAYPRREKLLEEYLARLAEVTSGDKDAQIRATSYVRRFGNALTNTKGQLEGLVRGGLADAKKAKEAELRAFIENDPARTARYGSTLDEIGKELAEAARHREADASLRDELTLPKLLSAATLVVRMAEERPKADKDRDPEYQERNWARHEQALRALTTSYHPKVDRALLALAVERMTRVPEAEQSAALGIVLGGGRDRSRSAIERAVEKLYAGTRLGDEATRVGLFQRSSTAELKKNVDPLVQLAVALRPLLREQEARRDRFSGRMAILKPRYIEALHELRRDDFAPDANGTLRLTYGTVRGYRPEPNAPMYRPFTRLSEVVAKNRAEEPFDVPAPLLAAHREKRFGPYVDDRLGEVPVDFLADLHITGGNSGSATLNARGELVGLVFDGNYEAMASDWVFVPQVTRSIHVDIRYVAWLLDGVFGGDHVLAEMGLKPSIP